MSNCVDYLGQLKVGIESFPFVVTLPNINVSFSIKTHAVNKGSSFTY